MSERPMVRIKVRVGLPPEQQMLREIVQGAVSMDGEMELVLPGSSASDEDILIVQTARDERVTLEAGGKVLALDRQYDHIDLYVLKLLERVRGSAQLASAIRKLVRPLIGPS